MQGDKTTIERIKTNGKNKKQKAGIQYQPSPPPPPLRTHLHRAISSSVVDFVVYSGKTTLTQQTAYIHSVQLHS